MVHQYKLGGYNIVLDICSGAIHVVDEVAYDVIEAFEKGEQEAIESVSALHKDVPVSEIKECFDQCRVGRVVIRRRV